MTPETLTPRTDAAEKDMSGAGVTVHTRYVPADLARQLERELADAREWSSKLADVADGLRADLATEREQLAANHEATNLMGKWLEQERELADRLAESLDRTLHLVAESGESPPEAEIDLAAWKEARRGTV